MGEKYLKIKASLHLFHESILFLGKDENQVLARSRSDSYKQDFAFSQNTDSSRNNADKRAEHTYFQSCSWHMHHHG